MIMQNIWAADTTVSRDGCAGPVAEQVRKWRRQLHTWDIPPSAGEQPVFTSGPANAWAPAASAVGAAEDGRDPHETAQTANADAEDGARTVSSLRACSDCHIA